MTDSAPAIDGTTTPHAQPHKIASVAKLGKAFRYRLTEGGKFSRLAFIPGITSLADSFATAPLEVRVILRTLGDLAFAWLDRADPEAPAARRFSPDDHIHLDRLKVTTREDFVGLGRTCCERWSGPVSAHVRFGDVLREAMAGAATGRILYTKLSRRAE